MKQVGKTSREKKKKMELKKHTLQLGSPPFHVSPEAGSTWRCYLVGDKRVTHSVCTAAAALQRQK